MKMNRVVSIMAVAIFMIMMSSSEGVDEPPTSCESRMSAGCNYTSSTNQKGSKTYCCAGLKEAAGFDRVCFCSIVSTLQAENTIMSDAYMNNIFISCNIPGTIDSLCSEKKSGSKIGIIIGISVGVLVLLVSLIIGTIVFCKCRRKQAQPETATATVRLKGPLPGGPVGTNTDGLVSLESLQYELEEIKFATDNFSKDNKIGRGGFGIVYKGALPNGQQIAVKRLLNGIGQGHKEFQTEVVLLAKLQHKNLVRLLGFCLTDEEAILVYEFVANKSLDYFLYDSKRREELNWPCRFEIIKGVARGMLYIHEDCPVRMMHRDLKAANVLLDAEMYPKIADFGLARICDAGQTHINPTRVVGTHGYMAPEYLFHGQYSAKSDVYAYGILILEIVSGRKISGSSFNQPGGEGLLGYTWRCWEDENPLEVMDPMLNDSFSSDEIIKCVQLGLLCVQENSNLRPTMSTVIHMLSSYTGVATLNMPQHPAYIYTGGSQPSTSASSTSSTTRLIP